MRLLCDSHVLVWWLDDPSRLSPKARAAITNPDNEVYFSAASVWELGLKIDKGKLQLPAHYVSALREDGFDELPVSVEHAEAATTLPAVHGDPFDRMLIAQTLQENLVLITRDAYIQQYHAPQLEA